MGDNILQQSRVDFLFQIDSKASAVTSPVVATKVMSQAVASADRQ